MAAVYAVTMADRISDEVGIREFKAQLSEHLGRVQFRDEVIAVTKNRKRVAVLVPIGWYERAVKLDMLVKELRERDPELFREIAEDTLRPASD